MNPPDPRWPNGAHVAVNFVINYEEGGEYAVPDGDAASEAGLTEGATAAVAGRDLAAESMFMYGSRAGFWRLYRIFTRRKLPCTVFAVARALERNPEARGGHPRSRVGFCRPRLAVGDARQSRA